jgi:23S rRNA pseudouridine2605 synthase
MGTRLNKYLARSGLGSRRKVEELITAGRITVNGTVSARLSTVIEPGDRVEFDGKPLRLLEERTYLMMNKPRGYITTLIDEKDRPTVMNLVPEKYRRAGVYPVGRLDRETEGLLLLTNDGDLAYRLTRPSFNVPKEYRVEIDRPLASEDRDKIARGLYLPQLDLKTRPCSIDINDDYPQHVRMVIMEGKKRQIRYSFMNCGYSVKKLERVSYGNLSLKRLRRGAIRVLTTSEVRELKKLAGQKA